MTSIQLLVDIITRRLGKNDAFGNGSLASHIFHLTHQGGFMEMMAYQPLGSWEWVEGGFDL